MASSGSADQWYIAAVLETDPDARADLLRRSVETTPSHVFAVWSAVQLCAQSGETTSCPLSDWERRLLELDRQNSEAWIRAAANRYAAKDHDGALAALRHAAAAAQTRTYLPESVEAIERGLAASTDLNFAERVATAFAIAAVAPPLPMDYVTMCAERSSHDAAWAHACLAYGERVEAQGRTEMGISMALVIQKSALMALGEDTRAAAAEQRLEARGLDRGDWTGGNYSLVQGLVFSDPTLFSEYMATLRSEGELAAQRQAMRETERRLAADRSFRCANP
jgi:hypothetical protein